MNFGLIQIFSLRCVSSTEGSFVRNANDTFKFFSQICLSDQSSLIDVSLWRQPLETCANPQARDHKVNRANLYHAPGKKEYIPPPWRPSFLSLSPDPEVTEQKKNFVLNHFIGKQGERVYTIGLERRVYTIEASDPEKEEKEHFHYVRFFLACGVLAAFENAKWPMSSFPTASGCGNCLGNS